MKNDFVKLFFSEDRYKYKESSSIEMDYLGLFLTTDVGVRRGYFFKEWALDENQFITGGDYSVLEKENGCILISEETSNWENNDFYFKISIQEFIKILDQWEEFCRTKPKEILITRENGVIKMEGKN